jgi:hypothetical protein
VRPGRTPRRKSLIGVLNRIAFFWNQSDPVYFPFFQNLIHCQESIPHAKKPFSRRGNILQVSSTAAEILAHTHHVILDACVSFRIALRRTPPNLTVTELMYGCFAEHITVPFHRGTNQDRAPRDPG